jgi:hypothetical protein
VNVPGGLSPSAFVLATLQTSASKLFVASAVPNTGAGTAKISLNKASVGTVTVGWFVIG